MTHSYEKQDSFTYVTRRIYERDMTHPYSAHRQEAAVTAPTSTAGARPPQPGTGFASAVSCESCHTYHQVMCLSLAHTHNTGVGVLVLVAPCRMSHGTHTIMSCVSLSHTQTQHWGTTFTGAVSYKSWHTYQ